ncbi:hypothetical protein CPB84DRAFT_1845819 [Gymnopilus junonius]|uniref:Uncharacterized protein n=1 Tax=Gymnopilus junonius TaxID=109634 RepID=A0A9P5NRW6_GYMJU|nr:hypothetical protein CPB84DRAFT_1845819 [Gymnopilus junonius]
MFNFLDFNMQSQPNTDIPMDEFDTVRIHHLSSYLNRPGAMQQSSKCIPATTHPLEPFQGAIPFVMDPRPSGPSSTGISQAITGAFPLGEPMETARAVNESTATNPNQSMLDQEAFIASRSEQQQVLQHLNDMNLDVTLSQLDPLLDIETVSQNSNMHPPLPQQQLDDSPHENTEPQGLPDQEAQLPKPFGFTFKPKVMKQVISIRRRLRPDKEVPVDTLTKRHHNKSMIDLQDMEYAKTRVIEQSDFTMRQMLEMKDKQIEQMKEQMNKHQDKVNAVLERLLALEATNQDHAAKLKMTEVQLDRERKECKEIEEKRIHEHRVNEENVNRLKATEAQLEREHLERQGLQEKRNREYQEKLNVLEGQQRQLEEPARAAVNGPPELPSPIPTTEGVIPSSGGHYPQHTTAVLQAVSTATPLIDRQNTTSVEMSNNPQGLPRDNGLPSTPSTEDITAAPQPLLASDQRQQVDDDVVMDDSPRGLLKGKAKVCTPVADESSGEDFDSVVSNDSDDENDKGSSRVPPPYHFKRPRGGAGPRLKVVYDDNKQPATQSTLNGLGGQIPSGNVDIAQVEAITKTVLSVLANTGALPSTPAKRRRHASALVKQPASKTCNAQSKIIGKAVRLHMNPLIGIKKDKMIRGVESPLLSVVEKYAIDDNPVIHPSLAPMSFCFEVKYSHPWNEELANQFMQSFLLMHNIRPEDRLIAYSTVKQRFTTLKALVKEAKPKEGEDEVQTRERVEKKDASKNKTTRRDTRCCGLANDRVDTAKDNRKGGKDPAWESLYQVASMLTPEGIAALIPYLEIIDRDTNKKNGLGNPIPGNPARQRMRMGGLISRSRVIPGLPANFYDATWYAGLSDSTKVDLRVKPAITLPTIMTDN